MLSWIQGSSFSGMICLRQEDVSRVDSCLNLDLTCRHDGHLSGHNAFYSQVGQSSSHKTTGEGQILQKDRETYHLMRTESHIVYLCVCSGYSSQFDNTCLKIHKAKWKCFQATQVSDTQTHLHGHYNHTMWWNQGRAPSGHVLGTVYQLTADPVVETCCPGERRCPETHNIHQNSCCQ